jgi:hypothetical protein
MLRTKEEREAQQLLIKSRGKGLGSAVLEGGLKQQSRSDSPKCLPACLPATALTKAYRF